MNKRIYLIILLLTCRICNAQNFINPSVEIWGNVNVCEVNTAPDFWPSYSNGCAPGPDEANFLICPTTIPTHAADGNVYARMCANDSISGEGMRQMVSGFVTGNSYLINFDYAGSNLFSGTLDIQWHVFINDMDVNQTPVFYSTDTTWVNYSYIFIATNTSLNIGFRVYTTGGSYGSGAIDNLSIALLEGVANAESKINVLIFPNPFSDNINIHSLNYYPLEIILYDITSRKIMQQEFTNSISLNTEQLEKGIYLYEVRDKNGLCKQGKVVKD